MNFTTTNTKGKMISVSGRPSEFILFCNFPANKEPDFWNGIGKEFEESLKKVTFDHKKKTSAMVFRNEKRDAGLIMERIIQLFEDSVK